MTYKKLSIVITDAASRHPPSGMKGDDCMTGEEREEALTIARSLFNDEYIKSYLKNKRQNNLQPQINS